MVDTDGRGRILEPQPDDVQDRDGALVVLRLSRGAVPIITPAFANSGMPARPRPRRPRSASSSSESRPTRLALQCIRAVR